MNKRDQAAQTAYLKKALSDFAALPEHYRKEIDATAESMRTAFGSSANWMVWGEEMVSWEALPEENRMHWRTVVARILAE